MANSINIVHEMVNKVGWDVEEIDVKRIVSLAEQAGDLMSQGLIKEAGVAFDELGDMFNRKLKEMGKEGIDFTDLIKMPDASTLEKMTSGFASAIAKNISNGIEAGLHDAANQTKKFMKDSAALREAYEKRNKNTSGAKTGKHVRSGFVNKAKGAFEYEPSDTAIKIGNNLRAITNEFSKATSWEDQYVALLKYIKAYEKLESVTSDPKSLERWATIGDYAIQDLKDARPEIEHSLQNIFNVAYGKATVGLTDAGDVDIGVKLTPIKMIDVYDVTGGKGHIEVEVEPVIKKARKNETPNMLRGVHKPESNESRSRSRDALGAAYWASPESAEFIARAYGENSLDGGDTIKAHANPLNPLKVSAKFKNQDGEFDTLNFDQIDQIELLKYLFPGVEKFRTVASPDGLDRNQKFYNEMARQAGFDLLEIDDVNEGKGREHDFEKIEALQAYLSELKNIENQEKINGSLVEDEIRRRAELVELIQDLDLDLTYGPEHKEYSTNRFGSKNNLSQDIHMAENVLDSRDYRFDAQNVNELMPLQDRIVEYIGRIPDYLEIEKFTPDIERIILSQQKGTAERFYDSKINELEQMLAEAADTEKTGKYRDKKYISQSDDVRTMVNKLPSIIEQVKQMRDVALANIDEEISKYGGYIEEEVQKGLPQVVVPNEYGELVGKVTEGTLRESLEYIKELSSKASNVTNKEKGRKLEDEIDHIEEVLLAGIADDIKDDAYDVLDSLKSEDATIEDATKFFAPYLTYDMDSSSIGLQVTEKERQKIEVESNNKGVGDVSSTELEAEKAKAESLQNESEQQNSDIAEKYKNASESVKSLVNDLITLDQRMQTLDKRITSTNMDGFDKWNPSDEHKNTIVDTLNEYERVMKQISDFSIETDDDKKRLIELKEEALQLADTLKMAYRSDSNPESYIKEYGVSREQAGVFMDINNVSTQLYNEIRKTLGDAFSSAFKQLSVEDAGLARAILDDEDSFSKLTVAATSSEKAVDSLNDSLKETQNLTSGVETSPTYIGGVSAEELEAEKTRAESLQNDLDTANKQNSELREQLANANTGSGDASSAELEAAQAEAERLRQENTRLLESNENLRSDLDFNNRYYGDALWDMEHRANEAEERARQLEKKLSEGSGDGGLKSFGSIDTTDEQAELTKLKTSVESVTSAIKDKTQEFLTEQSVVKKVAQSEVHALGEVEKKLGTLKDKLININTLLRNIKTGEDVGTGLSGNVTVNVNYPKSDDGNSESSIDGLKNVLDSITYNVKLANDGNEAYALDSTLRNVNTTLGEIKNNTTSISSNVTQNAANINSTIETTIVNIAGILQTINGKIVQGTKVSVVPQGQPRPATAQTTGKENKANADKAYAEQNAHIKEWIALSKQLGVLDAKINSGLFDDTIIAQAKQEQEFVLQRIDELVDLIDNPDDGLAAAGEANFEGHFRTVQEQRSKRIKQLSAKYDELGSVQAHAENAGSLSERERYEVLLKESQAELDSLNLSKEHKGELLEILKARHDNAYLAEKEKIDIEEKNVLYKEFLGLVKQVGAIDGAINSGGMSDIDKQAAQLEKERLTGRIDDIREKLNLSRSDLIESASKSLIGEEKGNVSQRQKSLKELAKQYKNLGIWSARAEQEKTQEAKTRVAQLKEEIEAKIKSLQLTQEELDALGGIAVLANKQRTESIKAKQKDKIDRAAKKKQAMTGKAGSAIGRAQDVLINAVGLNEESDTPIPASFNKQIAGYGKNIDKLIEKHSEISQSKVVTKRQQNDLLRQTKIVREQTDSIGSLVSEYQKLSGDNIKQDWSRATELDFNNKNLSVDVYKTKMEEYVREVTKGGGKIKHFDAATKTLTYTVKTGAHEFTEYTAAVRNLDHQLVSVRGTTTKTETFFEATARKMKELTSYFSGMMIFNFAKQEFMRGIQYVREIDLALTELKKVTDETDEAYDEFLKSAAETGSKLGSTISAVTEATATFAKLGYTMKQSAKMAEAAIVYKNVGDNIASTEDAADSIISTLKGFGLKASESMEIVDRFNEVGNKFAITSQGIGEALRLSASALNEGGNSLDESIAMITAANEVVNDPSSVGTALKTKNCLCV